MSDFSHSYAGTCDYRISFTKFSTTLAKQPWQMMTSLRMYIHNEAGHSRGIIDREPISVSSCKSSVSYKTLTLRRQIIRCDRFLFLS